MKRILIFTINIFRSSIFYFIVLTVIVLTTPFIIKSLLFGDLTMKEFTDIVYDKK